MNESVEFFSHLPSVGSFDSDILITTVELMDEIALLNLFAQIS
jgi:hypothetical protein